MTYLFLDIFFSIILIIGVIVGVKKGAIKIFLSLLATVSASFLTYCLGATVSSYIYNKFIEPSLINKIYSYIQGNGTSKEVLPKFITQNADKFGIELDRLKLSNSVSKEDVANLVENNLYKTIYGLLNIVVSIVLFIVILLLLKFILNLFNKLVKHSFVSGINSILGGAFGILNGIVIIVILCFVLNLCFKNAIKMPHYFTEESVNNSLFYRLFLYIF